MSITIKNYEAKFKKVLNPKIGLVALSTDQTIESDFNSICKNLPLDIFVNRIHNQNPLSKENLIKMEDDLEEVANKILPKEKLSAVAYGCTSGTIAIGEEKVKEKILLAKPNCYVTTPITSANFLKNDLYKISCPHLTALFVIVTCNPSCDQPPTISP